MVLVGQLDAMAGHLFGAEQLGAQRGLVRERAGRAAPETKPGFQSAQLEQGKNPLDVHRFPAGRLNRERDFLA
ncbi:hypothetical protein ACFPTX_03120 [Pseudomonas sp. GCM10022188]|uniref:hypothetical protein n=1 Tax=Pseudomonas TaxID=286 RepID=UPI001E43B8A6|nr:hypothetical protein [Pseudomonas oryzagri]MCC6076703.1 hypothetical protein [Pseudomonas oryzagri]